MSQGQHSEAEINKQNYYLLSIYTYTMYVAR